MTDPTDLAPTDSLDPSGAASTRLMQPYAFAGVTSSDVVRERWGHLEPGSETGETVTVAGRLMLREN